MNELRKRRKELGLTQVQVANACGVSRRTYQIYEEDDNPNKTFAELLESLEKMGVVNGSNFILSIKAIKSNARQIFRKYPEVKCAYLYGSYARGEATGKSDVDILVVCHKMGLKFFKLLADLEDALHKEVDLQTLEQMVGSEVIMEKILKEGIKIYG